MTRAVGRGRMGEAGRSRAGGAPARSSDAGAAPIETPLPWRLGRPKGTGMQRVYAQVREDIIALRRRRSR